MENDEKSRNFLLGIGVIMIVLIILIPLPGIVLDILTVLNLALVILIFLTVLKSKKLTDFLLLPTVILMSTIYSLLVNISSARLILTKGAAFDGQVIRLVASHAAGSGEMSSVIVSFVVFIVITIVLLRIITVLARRVAKIAARLTLDSVPGKLISIEDEQSSGMITEEEAIIKKETLERETDFYGALDGVGKFIFGYAKMCCLISVIIIFGGIVTDVLLRGEALTDAIKTYLPLSIGCGTFSLFHIALLYITTLFGFYQGFEALEKRYCERLKNIL